MASIVVRNIPDNVFELLKEQAVRHKRSVEAEVRSLIESSVNWSEQARKFQEELKGRTLSPSIELLHESRDSR